MAKQFTLGKNERLRSRKLIEQLFSEGRSYSVYPFRVNFLMKQKSAESKQFIPLRFGAAVSSKNFRKATDRNRIKRLTREAWRLQKGPLKEKLISAGCSMNLFLIYNGKELPGFQLVYNKVQAILNKLITIVNENNPADS